MRVREDRRAVAVARRLKLATKLAEGITVRLNLVATVTWSATARFGRRKLD